MMIDVIGLKHGPRKLRKKIVFLVRRAIRPNDADRAPTLLVANFSKPLSDQFKSFFPGRRRQFAVLANQRLGKALFMMRKVESVAVFDAQEIAIDPALVAVVPADDLRASVAAAHAQSGFAAVPAVGADRTHMVHLPRTRLVAIGARGERADRTDVDTHPTLFAVE